MEYPDIYLGKRLASQWDDDIVHAISNNGLSVTSGFQVRVLVAEPNKKETDFAVFFCFYSIDMDSNRRLPVYSRA